VFIVVLLYFILDHLKKKIGRGSFGEVFLAEDVKGNIYAIKKIRINKWMSREMEIAKMIGSKHGCNGVIRFFDSFQKDENYYIIMEYCEKGSLSKVIKTEQGYLSKEDVSKFTYFFF
jgi:serine/threonine protein kinase